MIRAGFAISWHMADAHENESRLIGIGIQCSRLQHRPRLSPARRRRTHRHAPRVRRRAKGRTARGARATCKRGNIAPVDLAQAAIGPGMAVYTRYAKVLDAEGKPLSVREALALINQTLDEALAEQEGDFDADSRWALTWFEQSGFAEGEYGVAEQLSKAKNTSVAGMVEAGILESKRGKVRLLKPEELPADWDPATDPRLTAWEIVHHLIRVLASGGEGAAAGLVAKLGAQGGDRPRTGLPPLHPLRAQEARGRGARLQRPRPELARNRPPRPARAARRQPTQAGLFEATEA